MIIPPIPPSFKTQLKNYAYLWTSFAEIYPANTNALRVKGWPTYWVVAPDTNDHWDGFRVEATAGPFQPLAFPRDDFSRCIVGGGWTSVDQFDAHTCPASNFQPCSGPGTLLNYQPILWGMLEGWKLQWRARNIVTQGAAGHLYFASPEIGTGTMVAYTAAPSGGETITDSGWIDYPTAEPCSTWFEGFPKGDPMYGYEAVQPVIRSQGLAATSVKSGRIDFQWVPRERGVITPTPPCHIRNGMFNPGQKLSAVYIAPPALDKGLYFSLATSSCGTISFTLTDLRDAATAAGFPLGTTANPTNQTQNIRILNIFNSVVSFDTGTYNCLFSGVLRKYSYAAGQTIKSTYGIVS